jgi:RHS repeat-associated protein
MNYDGGDRVNAVSGTFSGQPTAYGVTYAAHGASSFFSYGNQLARTLAYNSRLQPDCYSDTAQNSPASYVWAVCPSWGGTNNNGNLQSEIAYVGGPGPLNSLAQSNRSCSYDAVNRLTSASDSSSWSRGFGYDAYGNMWVTGSSGVALAGNTPTSNVYNGNNQMAGTGYDAGGNQVTVNGDVLAYDAENHVALAMEPPSLGGGIENYVYDGEGRRIGKWAASNATVYVYDAFGQLAAEYSTATNAPPCTTCYLSSDHLGSTRLVTDQSGNIVARHDYLPFGEEAATNGADNINQKFTGKERDQETGLDYFGARYYGSALGRFTSPDPLGGKLVDPQTLNRYAYVRNNPLSLTDPTGLYIVNCTAGNAKDQKNCNKAADGFETQRQKDLKSKNVKVRDAATAWGNRGEDNHVNVTFKAQQQVDADANTQPGYKTDAMVTPGTTSDHQPNINAEFSEDLRGKDLAQTIAHEGSHIEDDMNFLKSYDPATGQYFGGLNFTHFDTEFQAFGAGSMVKPYTMFPRGPSGYQQLTNYIYRAYPNADQLVFPPSIYPQGNPPR